MLATGVDPTHPALARLTLTEREVAERIVAGDTNAAIARRRRTSVKTVANQVASIFAKLGVQSRRALVSHLSLGRREPAVAEPKAAAPSGRPTSPSARRSP